MNILIIDMHSPIGFCESDRYHCFAREWHKSGHDVTIVTADYSTLRGDNRKAMESACEKTEFHQELIKIPVYKNIKGAVNYAYPIFLRKFRFQYIVLRKLFRYDAVVLSSSDPRLILPLHKAAVPKKIKLYYDMIDLWPFSGSEKYGMKAGSPAAKKLSEAEDWAFAYSQRVVASGEFMKSHLIHKQFTASDYFLYLPSGISPDLHSFEGQLTEEAAAAVKQIRGNKNLILGSIDDETSGETIEHLIKAAPLCEEGISFLIAARPEKKEVYRYMVNNLGLQNKVFIVSRGSTEEDDAVLSYSDFLYFGAKKNSFYRYGMLFHGLLRSMLASRPVIYGFSGSNNPVSESECGITVEPCDAGAIAGAMNEMLEKNLDEYEMMCVNAKNNVLSQYNNELIAKEYADLFELSFKRLPV